MLLSTLPAGQGGAAPREALWEVALLGGGRGGGGGRWRAGGGGGGGGGGRLLSGSCAHSFLKVSLDAQQPQGLERPPPHCAPQELLQTEGPALGCGRAAPGPLAACSTLPSWEQPGYQLIPSRGP